MARHCLAEDFDFFHGPVAGAPLFTVAPYDPAGPFRESLSSLIIRIARAHAVSPRDMLFEVVANHYPEIGKICKGTFFRHYSAPMNGLGKYAELFSDAIGNLAALPNVSRHTLLPLRHTFASQGSPVIYQGQRWCAGCLRDMVLTGIEPYRPLLWSFASVAFCSKHKRQLDECCPRCGATQPVIPRWPDIDYCDSCRASLLTDVPATRSERNMTATSARSTWNALACIDLLENLGRIDPQQAYTNFRTFIDLATRAISDGNRAEFCRQIGLSIHALNKWISGKDRPTLESFLRLLYALDILPFQVLFIDSHPAERDIRIARQLQPVVRRLRNSSHAETPPISLLTALACDTPPTLSQLAATLNLSRAGLKYRYPDLCKEAARRRRAYFNRKANRRLAERKKFIVDLVIRSWAAGIMPGKDLVESELRKRGCSLLSVKLRRCYHDILAQLMNN